MYAHLQQFKFAIKPTTYFAKVSSKYCQILHKPSKIASILKFYQNGEISQNLVTFALVGTAPTAPHATFDLIKVLLKSGVNRTSDHLSI